MSSESDGNSDMELVEDDENWTEARENRKAKRKRTKDYSQEEVNNIILGPAKKTQQINTTQKATTSSSTIPKNTSQNINKNTSTNNYSLQMQNILNQQYKNMYYLMTNREFTRTQIADFWNSKNPQSRDVIIKTSKGFLLKTNLEKNVASNYLTTLKQSEVLQDFQETNPNRQTANKTINATFACVIASVEQDIEDLEMREFLEANSIKLRYCKRITSRATGKLTQLIRIITGDFPSFQKLLNEGVFYKNKHYPVHPSTPPEPVPSPCAKCSLYTHTTELCNLPLTCRKCKGKHSTSNCTSPLPEKCTACNSEEHQAWSVKCPKRPVKPIEGIPNTRIKSLNKKSCEIDKKITKNNKIHTPMTLHDHIIETYTNKFNKPKYTNRQELIVQLKKRFINLYNIDTTVVFSGNHMFILMFDLDKPNTTSPTEPTEGLVIHSNGY